MKTISLQLSLRAKVTLGVVLPLILILGIITAAEYKNQESNALSDLSLLASYSGQAIELNLRQAMMESDFLQVQNSIDIISASEEFQRVFIIDTSGQVIFAPDDMENYGIMDTNQPDCQVCHRFEPDERPKSVVVTTFDNQRVFRSMRPIENSDECAECHDEDEQILGALVTDISLLPLQSTLTNNLRNNLLWGISAVVSTVIIVNIVLSQIVFRRLQKLNAAITHFGQGKALQLLPENQSDEIGQISIAFNAMANQVELRDAQNRELSENLRLQNTQRGELLKRLITAQEDERKRIARELHDELGQILGGLALHTEVLERFIISDSARATEQLDQVQTLIGEVTDKMYDLILDLRPSALDDLGLAAALDIYAKRLLSKSEITFELQRSELTERLPSTIETALYRIFQEALNNVARHASAKSVRIKLARHNNNFVGEIVDDGQGFELDSIDMNGQSPRGLGLLGMRERVVQCGGQLEIITQPGKGTKIHLHITLNEETSHV